MLYYLLFALYMVPASFHFFTFSTFHLYPGGGSEGLYLPADNAEKIRKHIRKQINICVMGIILSRIPVSNSPIRHVFSEAVEFF